MHRRDVLVRGAALLTVSAGAARAERKPFSQGFTMQALSQIRQIDYTVIFVRDMDAMRHFYETVMAFPLVRTLGDRWFEYQVGSTTLALRAYGPVFNDPPPAPGALSLQMAFRVAPPVVADCAAALEAKGVKLVAPLTDQPWGHRTIFFRDPDGNVLEIFAEI
ncbi:VOC family protein [Reyranella sp. CPCC 100927]|uniref:VOC family protein n=1 Tax=Reyranella sp. CPCC 100927 TaxID=2599616 RepID=UPI0021084073|nr:VOC family protein [Reyranella sp. CPCC 100927]